MRGERLVARQGLFQQAAQGVLAHVEGHLAGGNLLHVQQIVDEVAEAQAVAVRDLQHLLDGRRRLAQGAPGDQAERAADGSQRGAQFVTDR